ncbi:uncharacterized protein PV09_04582 [Verruconis gallopava]|uniref:DUF4185 domain-containing protein n=1 Tax=Verruconis gallopava TaxID=253628 RepID=A0A0D2ACU2_9PEZI|nr:uncharacterized protein PV09_04582 [Verruconis gallopava]KIW04285.1 hypothetical protein PV09_04582 [Verruconis gallopava]
MPFKRFRSRLSSRISQDSSVSQGTDEQSCGRPSFEPHHPVLPRVKGKPRVLGLVGDPQYNRDSGGSAKFGDRIFWTWRDTQLVNNGKVQELPILASTASWSDLNHDGSPAVEPLQSHADPLRTITLQAYGKNSTERAYFRIIHDGAEPRAGMQKDGTRRALWPDSPPMVTSTSDNGRVTAYSWIKKTHIRPDLSTVTQHPATTLYRITYAASENRDALPYAKLVDASFWNQDEIAYGAYGNVVKDGIAYLFGQINGMTALARVLVDRVERKSMYEYWVGGEWTKTKPNINDRSIDIPNANAGGQGTYYFSEPWDSFVWIGGSIFPGADCYITTARTPTGPWIKPFKFYSGANGTASLPAYSIQAHPGMLRDEDENAIYITYTKCDRDQSNTVVYSTPLVYVEWEDDDESE